MNESSTQQLQKRFDPQALTSLTFLSGIFLSHSFRFRSTGSYEPDPGAAFAAPFLERFRSTGSYEPDPAVRDMVPRSGQFRSTGSYEPDPADASAHWYALLRFDPQALTSLTAFILASSCFLCQFRSTGSYEPDQCKDCEYKKHYAFRSTGSYEPDHYRVTGYDCRFCFDPQALTSLTTSPRPVLSLASSVSIHRLLRA